MILDIRMNFSQYDALGKPFGIEGVLASMDKYGIDKAVLVSTLAVNADFRLGAKEMFDAIKSNDRLYGYLPVNPSYPEDTVQLMRSVMSSSKFVAAALFQGSTRPYPNLEDYRYILNAYRRFGKPVFVNTPDAQSVAAAEEIAKEFGTIKFIYGSMGGDEWQRAISNNKQLNVYLEASGSFDADKIEAAVTNLGPHRVLFGSNAPFSDPASMLALVQSSNISQDTITKILSSNAEKVLGLAKKVVEPEVDEE
ncbi:MAG: amidohydrolase family protein [Armatimonadota bacterium]